MRKPKATANVAAWYSASDDGTNPPRPDWRLPPKMPTSATRARSAARWMKRLMTGSAVVSIARIEPELARRS